MKTSHQKRLRLNGGSRGVEVIFEKREDRWGHRLLIEDGGGWLELLGSLEGNDQQAWPPSPPIQDLDQHELSRDCQAILGVGGAGRSHWSASFSTEVVAEVHESDWEKMCTSLQKMDIATPPNFLDRLFKKDMNMLFVEIACLVKGSAKPDEISIQSSYQIAEDVLVERFSPPNGPGNSPRTFGSILAIHSQGQLRALIAPSENTNCELIDGNIVFAPGLISCKQGNSIGWSYRIVVC